MKSIKTAEWTTDGRKVKIEVEVIKEVNDNIAYADGHNVNLGKKTFEAVEIKLSINGKIEILSRSTPTVMPKNYKDYDKLVKQGAYARLGNKLISQKVYGIIMNLLTDADAECTTQEFTEIKAAEDAKKAKEDAALKCKAEAYAKAVKNGLCPKCGTYCYGDCEAN